MGEGYLANTEYRFLQIFEIISLAASVFGNSAEIDGHR